MPLQRRTIWESINADGPQEYTDGYGQTRQMYESPVISGIRKYIVQPIKKVNRKLNPTDEDWRDMGMEPPLEGLGVLGLLNAPNFLASNTANFVNKREVLQTLKDADTYYSHLKPNQRQLVKSFITRLNRGSYMNNGSMKASGYRNSVASIKRAINQAKSLSEAEAKSLESLKLPSNFKKPNLKPTSIQKIVESDFTPFDEMLTPFQTNSRSFTTSQFRLSDFYKGGGVVSAKSGIHIKKANRGKFTDYCGGKVTSECIARGKRSPNPAIRKRATFAANARKWKHQYGGKIVANWVFNKLNNENT